MKHLLFTLSLLFFSNNVFGMSIDTISNKPVNPSLNTSNVDKLIQPPKQDEKTAAVIIFSPTAPNNYLQEVTDQTAQDRLEARRKKARRDNHSRILAFYFGSGK